MQLEAVDPRGPGGWCRGDWRPTTATTGSAAKTNQYWGEQVGNEEQGLGLGRQRLPHVARTKTLSWGTM